jgi:hypothetical protein
MDYEAVRCPNMNHNKSNAPCKYCPSCGKVVNAGLHTKCDHQKHFARRKDRDQFCIDCGQSLTK